MTIRDGIYHWADRIVVVRRQPSSHYCDFYPHRGTPWAFAPRSMPVDLERSDAHPNLHAAALELVALHLAFERSNDTDSAAKVLRTLQRLLGDFEGTRYLGDGRIGTPR